MRTTLCLATACVALVLTGCPKDKVDSDLTRAEARSALEESTASSQAQALTSTSIDLYTSFTLGDGAQKALEEMKAFVDSQLPCAQTTLEGKTLEVEYGARPGTCVYKGNTFKGSHSVTVSKNDGGQVIVDHEWTAFTNGKITLDGTSHVTWDFDDAFRKIEHTYTWKRPNGSTGKDTGTLVQTPLPGGLAEGLQVDGDRSWESKTGRWDLEAEGVQVRWQDPVPQAGLYRLAAPNDKALTLSFRRVDADTIAVTLTNGKQSFTFNVNSIGVASEM